MKGNWVWVFGHEVFHRVWALDMGFSTGYGSLDMRFSTGYGSLDMRFYHW